METVTGTFLTEESGIVVPKSDMTTEKSAEVIRESVKNVFAMDDRLQIVEGELLWEITENGYYKEWGFRTFDEYVESELGFKTRKAYYLIAIYETFVRKLDLDADELREIEWSKAKELVTVIDDSNKEDLLEAIKTLSVSGVKAMVRDMKGITSLEEKEVFKKLTVGLAEDQYENILAAIKIISEKTGTESIGTALDLMSTDFLASDMAVPSAVSMEQLLEHVDGMLKNIARTFGVVCAIESVNADVAPVFKEIADVEE